MFDRSGTDRRHVTAGDLLLVIEVVTTTQRRKEVKDTVFQRALNEHNKVPELGLVFPDKGDPRSLQWHRLVDGRYEEIALSEADKVESATIEGLVLRVKPQTDWEDGKKIDVCYRGEWRLRLDGERARSEQRQAQAEQEKARADRLAQRLRELGVDPDAVAR